MYAYNTYYYCVIDKDYGYYLHTNQGHSLKKNLVKNEINKTKTFFDQGNF